MAAQTESAVTNAAKGMEDAFASFVTTGKLNFTSLANSIIADIVRMQARAAISGLFNMVAGMIGGGIANSFGTLATTSTAASAASGVMSSGFSSSLMGPTGMMPLAGARASGGPVAGGSTYLVGEKGPELFTPGSSGSIVPNHALGGGGGGVSVQIVNNGNSQVQQPQVSQDSSGQKFIRLIIDQAKNEMAGEVAGGQGVVSKALTQRYGLTPRFR
jgi:lambda family phage tail tape measure protein